MTLLQGLNRVLSKDLIEDGVWDHLFFLDDDQEKVFLYLDGLTEKRPMRIKVRSEDCAGHKAYIDRLGAKQVTAMRSNKGKKNVDQTQEEMAGNEFHRLEALLAEVENLGADDVVGPQPVTKEFIKELMTDPTARFIIDRTYEVAGNRSLYKPEGAVVGEKKAAKS